MSCFTSCYAIATCYVSSAEDCHCLIHPITSHLSLSTKLGTGWELGHVFLITTKKHATSLEQMKLLGEEVLQSVLHVEVLGYVAIL